MVLFLANVKLMDCRLNFKEPRMRSGWCCYTKSVRSVGGRIEMGVHSNWVEVVGSPKLSELLVTTAVPRRAKEATRRLLRVREHLFPYSMLGPGSPYGSAWICTSTIAFRCMGGGENRMRWQPLLPSPPSSALWHFHDSCCLHSVCKSGAALA